MYVHKDTENNYIHSALTKKKIYKITFGKLDNYFNTHFYISLRMRISKMLYIFREKKQFPLPDEKLF